MYGSPEAKKVGDVEMQQHSRLVARGKYLHVFECKSHTQLIFDDVLMNVHLRKTTTYSIESNQMPWRSTERRR